MTSLAPKSCGDVRKRGVRPAIAVQSASPLDQPEVVLSTTAQAPWPYFARCAAEARRDVVFGGWLRRDDFAPDANGTTTGSRPRPTRGPPADGPAGRALRERLSAA